MIQRGLCAFGCSLIATLALMLPTEAEAASAKNLYGVTPYGYPQLGELQRLARAGAGSIRISIPWENVEPSAGARNWDLLDRIVADASLAGVAVLPLFYGTPSWVSPKAASPPIYSADQRAAWTAFVRDVASRYGIQGTFWTLRPEVPRRPIVIWQVWNEVNLRYYWGSRPNARRYLDLIELTKKALRAGDPSAKVLLAGLIPFKSIGAGSVPGDRYLQRLYKLKGARGLIDAVDVHPYGGSASILIKALERTRETLNSVGARRTPLWVTEFGWSTGGADWRGSPLRATPAQQAKRVSTAYKLMKRSRKRLRLKRAFYFSLTDFPAADSWIGHMGLFDSSGQPKPAWFAYVRRSGGQP